jgi:phosphate/sulfate permease
MEGMLAVASASVITVLLATRLGFPKATTHKLTGAPVSAGVIASFYLSISPPPPQKC